MPTINGKKPLSEKMTAKPAGFSPSITNLFGDMLSVDPAIKKTLESKGLACRWVNAPKLEEMSGYHNRGWRPVKASECGSMDGSFTNGPDGYIRRGDCVLAVRPLTLHEQHRQYLQQTNAARTHSASDKAQAAELREAARKAGVDVKIHDGFEDENNK